MITYFVELPSPALVRLFAERPEVPAGLASSGGGVAMAMLNQTIEWMERILWPGGEPEQTALLGFGQPARAHHLVYVV